MGGFIVVLLSIGSFALGATLAALIVRAQRPSSPDTAAAEKAALEKAAELQKQALAKQKEQLDKSAQSVKEILVGLALAVKSVDGAATKSSHALTTVRNKIYELALPKDLARCQELIIGEVDKVIHTNADLRQELARAQDELNRQRKVIDLLQTAATTDHLTQVANRASFDDYFKAASDRFVAGGPTFAFIIADIDHFKNVNDQYGHVAGDRVLEAVANKLRVCLRGTDFLARYGGEEFAIILERTTLPDAVRVAENLRNAIETTVFNLGEQKLRLTISLGCAVVNKGAPENDVVVRADKQLYMAKNSGRNRVFPPQEDDLPSAAPTPGAPRK